MTQISLRIDEGVKKQAEEVCSDIGMSLSTAITIYLKRLGRERRVPFELTADPFYYPENITVVKSRIRDLDAKKNIESHELIED